MLPHRLTLAPEGWVVELVSLQHLTSLLYENNSPPMNGQGTNLAENDGGRGDKSPRIWNEGR